jgi:hypothetical protein
MRPCSGRSIILHCTIVPRIVLLYNIPYRYYNFSRYGRLVNERCKTKSCTLPVVVIFKRTVPVGTFNSTSTPCSTVLVQARYMFNRITVHTGSTGIYTHRYTNRTGTVYTPYILRVYCSSGTSTPNRSNTQVLYQYIVPV